MKKILTLSLALIVGASVCTVSAGKKKDKKNKAEAEVVVKTPVSLTNDSGPNANSAEAAWPCSGTVRNDVPSG